MGLIFNGNGDVIKAVDGSLTVEGLDLGGSSNVNAGIGTFSNLNVTGVLTYEDVKNVDSVGIVTAREGIFLPDTKELKLGNTAASPDLKLYSTGTNGWVFTPISGADLYMGTNAGEVYIQTGASGNDTAIKVTSGGAVDLYYNNVKKFSTTSSGVHCPGYLQVDAQAFATGGLKVNADNQKLRVGASDDLELWHDGSHSILKNSTGYLRLLAGGSGVSIGNGDNSEAMAYFLKDGAVDLYHNNVKKFETTAAGITVSGHIDLDDSNFLKAGTGDDLWVGHDGSHSYINHNGTGGLFVQSSGGFFVQKYGTTERLINANNDGNVELFYDSVKKFETTSDGVQVLGRFVTSGEYNYLQSNSTSVATVTLKKSAGGADGIDYLQCRDSSNNLKMGITGAGGIMDKDGQSGNAGQILSSTGTQLDWINAPSGTTINSNADDRIITGSGTAGTLNGETNLTYSSSFLLKNTTATSSNNTEILRLENTHSDGKMTVLGFRTTGLGSPQTKIYGGNDNTGANSQGGNSGAGKFKVTITNPSGMHQEVIYAENDANSASKFVRFSTDGTERMRIRSDGEIVMGLQAGVAYDTDTLFVNGPSSSGRPTMEVHGNGNNSPSANSSALHIKQNCTNAPDTAAALKITHTNPLAGQEGALITCYSNINNSNAQRSYGFFSTGRIIQNRPNNDGTLISFRHNNTSEGSISISGGSVSYNGGVLTRWSQFVGLSTTSKEDRPTIYQGTVLSNLDEMCEWTGEDNQQLNKTKVSDTVSDKDVAGAVSYTHLTLPTILLV